MKEIDFIGSENVVNRTSSKKMSLFGILSTIANEFVLSFKLDKKNHFNSKKIDAVKHFTVFNGNFDAMPIKISIRNNN
ncbi:MAG: hypothetical protein RQ864_12725 [Lutibacter sp.]|nr:hypothetical protein [Lutibacter sp.]